MLRLLLTALALATALIYMPNAAAGTPLACQGEESGGLIWENGRWNLTRFNLKKFILVQEGATLTKESVAKALSPSAPSPELLTCHSEGNITCHGVAGEFIYFSPATQRGTIAYTFGGLQTNPNRDTLSVDVFSCIKF